MLAQRAGPHPTSGWDIKPAQLIISYHNLSFDFFFLIFFYFYIFF